MKFQVHEDILCEVSTVFNSAFHSNFKEGSRKMMHLPEDEVDIFEHFVTYLYDHDLKLGMEDGADWRENQGHLMLTVRLYALAEKYDIETLKSKICKDLHRFIVDGIDDKEDDMPLPPCVAVVEHVYSNTSRSAPIRQIMADWFAWNDKYFWGDDDRSLEWLYGLPEFLFDLVIALEKSASISAKESPFKKTSIRDLMLFKKVGKVLESCG